MRAIREDDAGHRARGLTPDARCCAAARRTRTPSSRPRGMQPVLRGRPGRDRAEVRRARRAHWSPLQPCRVPCRCPRRGAGRRHDGLGRRRHAGDRRGPSTAEARRSASSPSGSTARSRPTPSPHCPRRSARSSSSTARRSRAPGRAAAPRRHDRPHGRRRRPLPDAGLPWSSAAATACRAKEFTPAMSQGGLRRGGQDAPKTRFTVGITDDVTHLSLDVDDSSGSRPTRSPRSSTASARMAPSARTRTR